MTVKIFDTPDVQDFLKTVAGFDQEGGNERAKQIMHRLLSDLFKLIDDFDVTCAAGIQRHHALLCATADSPDAGRTGVAGAPPGDTALTAV
ncbi:dioxygenase [Halomonas sp. JS92-SW72]|uniref:dioxygenase n=1 Tax=Halomonas sp. JS92-SW72 TaxID=2306583 RepID=UPI001F0958C2|nr:dioxygenase [Halomonas sp. JS92-SW72]